MLFWPLVILSAILLTIGSMWDDWRSYMKNGYYEVEDKSYYYPQKKKVHENPATVAEFFSGFIAFAIGSFIVIGILFFVVSSIVSSNVPSKSEYSYRYNIYALEDSVTTTFVVRRHYQTDDSSGIRFYHIYKTDDGGKKVGWVNQNNTTLYDDLTSNEQPHIQVYTLRKHFEDASTLQKLFLWKWTLWEEDKEYKIHVPPGTIGNDYNVDLK